MTGDFSAGPSALGFFYQARYALLLLLRNDSDYEMSLESLDDIVFERAGNPVELLQTKHHINSTASLSNASTDLWKTLRVWSTEVSQGQVQPEEVMFTLVTTARAPDESAASKLCPETSQGRDVNSALEILRETVRSSRSETNRPAYDAFSSLSDSQQRKLVSSIYVLDSSPNILDARDKIISELRVATSAL